MHEKKGSERQDEEDTSWGEWKEKCPFFICFLFCQKQKNNHKQEAGDIVFSWIFALFLDLLFFLFSSRSNDL